MTPIEIVESILTFEPTDGFEVRAEAHRNGLVVAVLDDTTNRVKVDMWFDRDLPWSPAVIRRTLARTQADMLACRREYSQAVLQAVADAVCGDFPSVDPALN